MKLLILVIILVSSCPMAWCAPKTGWKIEYVAGPFQGGGNTVWITPDAIKIKTKNQYEVYAKAPDWDAKIYNLKTHSMCVVPKTTYMQGKLFFESEETTNELLQKDVVSTESITSFGLRAQRQSWHTVRDDPNFYRFRRKPVKALTQLTTTTEIPHNKMQAALIGAWVPIPHLTAVPLVFVDKQENGRMQGRFYAKSLVKTTVSSNEFNVPTGYKKLARASQLFAEQYSGFFRGLGLEEIPAK